MLIISSIIISLSILLSIIIAYSSFTTLCVTTLLFIILILAIYWFKAGSKDIFSPELSINFYYLLTINTGFILYAIARPNEFISSKMFNIFILCICGFISMNLGFIFSKYTSAFNFRSIDSSNINYSKMQLPILLCSFIPFIAGFIFFYRSGNVPVLQENVETARVATLEVPSNGYFLFLMISITPIIAFYKSLFYKKDHDYIYVMLVLLALIMLLFTGSRRFALWLIINIVILNHYLKHRISVKLICIITVLMFIFINLFEIFRNPNSQTTASLWITMFFRFIVLIANFENIYNVIPRYTEHQHGSTFFMDFLTILPGKQTDYQSWLKQLTGLEFEGFGIPPTIVGDFYINFGSIGAILSMFIFGLSIRYIYVNLIINKAFNDFGILLYAFLLIYYLKMISAGLSSHLMPLLWESSVYAFLFILFTFITHKTRSIT